jgi:hypothetical protein
VITFRSNDPAVGKSLFLVGSFPNSVVLSVVPVDPSTEIRGFEVNSVTPRIYTDAHGSVGVFSAFILRDGGNRQSGCDGCSSLQLDFEDCVADTSSATPSSVANPARRQQTHQLCVEQRICARQCVFLQCLCWHGFARV